MSKRYIEHLLYGLGGFVAIDRGKGNEIKFFNKKQLKLHKNTR